jgi:hypothetical protein
MYFPDSFLFPFKIRHLLLQAEVLDKLIARNYKRTDGVLVMQIYFFEKEFFNTAIYINEMLSSP